MSGDTRRPGDASDQPADLAYTDLGPTDSASTPTPVAQDPGVEHAARVAEFSLFYTGQMPSLVAHLIYQGVPVRLAADLAQDAMTEAFRQWDDLDYPRAWIRTVAARTWHKRRADLDHEVLHSDVPAPMPLLTDAQAETIAQRHSVLLTLNDLPLAQREVMAWTVDGYQPTEIAAILGKPPATIRSLLRQARQRLDPAKTTGEAS